MSARATQNLKNFQRNFSFSIIVRIINKSSRATRNLNIFQTQYIGIKGAVCCEGALCSIYLLDKEQILLTLFLADQISRLTNGEFNSLNLSTQEGGGNIFKGYKINPFS